VRFARGSAAVATVVVAAALLGGCADSDEQAERQAVDQVRATAQQLRTTAQGVVSGGSSGQQLLDKVVAALPAGPDVIVFDRASDGDGFTVRVALHSRGEAGGGGTYSAVVARLCVELAGRPGTVELRDTPCGPDLPSATGNAGNVDVVTTLG
jgi:hypothetical protein